MQHNNIQPGAEVVTLAAIFLAPFWVRWIYYLPLDLHTPDGIKSAGRAEVDEFGEQCYVAEHVATGKCKPGLFKFYGSGRSISVTSNEIQETAKCFFTKMYTCEKDEVSKVFQATLEKRLGEVSSKYSPEDMKKLTSLIRHTKVEWRSDKLQFKKPGSGYVNIENSCSIFGNTVKISFYSTHTYTNRHINQAINNLFRVYQTRLSPTPELASNRTLSGLIRN